MDFASMVSNRLVGAHELLQSSVADLTDEEGSRVLAGQLMPAVWHIGHVALIDADYIERGGGMYALPPAYLGLFQRGADRSVAYPALSDVRKTLDGVHEALVKVSMTADYMKPVDGRAYSTVGEMLIQASVHRGYHIGKLSTLRALLGKTRLFG